MPDALSDEKRQEVVDTYLRLRSMPKTAKECGVSSSTVSRLVNAAGVKLKNAPQARSVPKPKPTRPPAKPPANGSTPQLVSVTLACPHCHGAMPLALDALQGLAALGGGR